MFFSAVCAVLRERGAKASAFDVRQVMRTDSHFGKAEPQIAELKRLATEKLQPLLEQQLLVTQALSAPMPMAEPLRLGVVAAIILRPFWLRRWKPMRSRSGPM